MVGSTTSAALGNFDPCLEYQPGLQCVEESTDGPSFKPDGLTRLGLEPAFGILLQLRLLLHHERPHVSLHDELVRNDTNKAQWRSPDKGVTHHHGIPIDEKFVHVSKADKCTLHHLVHEPIRTIEFDDLRRQTLPNSEVHPLEGDDIAQIEKTRGLAAHHAFARRRGCP
jgi:hypothetical protein